MAPTPSRVFDADRVGFCPSTALPDVMRCDPATFTAVVEACAATGMRSLSATPVFLGAGGGPAAAAEAAAAHGVRVACIEAAINWAGGDRAAVDAEAIALLNVAESVGAELLLAVTLEPALASASAAAAGFARLCAHAADAGVRVSLEFLPWTGIATIRTAWEIVERAGAENGGILLDTWHWQRQPGGPDHETLRTVPGDRVFYVQLCDAAPVAQENVLVEAMTGRLLPGQGVVDFAAVEASLDAIGARPFVATEVFNTALALQGPEACVRANRDAVDALLR